MVSRLLPHWIFGMVTHHDHSRVPDPGVCQTRHGRDQTWGTNRPNNCSFFIETWPPPLNAATGPWWFSNWNCRWEYPCAPKFAECVLVIFATKDSKPETCRKIWLIRLVWRYLKHAWFAELKVLILKSCGLMRCVTFMNRSDSEIWCAHWHLHIFAGNVRTFCGNPIGIFVAVQISFGISWAHFLRKASIRPLSILIQQKICLL